MSAANTPIAIVGVAGLFPQSETEHDFWRNIVEARDLLTDIPESHFLIGDFFDADRSVPDKLYVKRGGFVPRVQFDPMEFGIPPSALSATDTAQLLALVVAKRALLDAFRGDLSKIDRERTSTILGLAGPGEAMSALTSRLQRPTWVKAMREHGLPEADVQAICDRIASNFVPWSEASFPGLLSNVVAGRIANRLDLHGTNFVVDAACGSGLAAIAVAADELRLGKSDVVLAGGVDANNDPFTYMCFTQTPALSPTDDCRPFSAKADGTMIGEGFGMFVLKRLADAEAAGDKIYAVIRGIGAASDGRAKSIYAPLPEGQVRALERTYAAAGYGPETVELMEAHGTATAAGDVAEVEGLSRVFAARQGGPSCALGSVKSQIGHTKGAAGAAGMFKAVMALSHKVLPPTIKVEAPNPALQLERSAFYLNTEARPWIRGAEHPRRAAVSSFGFGGTNFHVTLEEHPGAPRWRSSPSELVLIGDVDAQKLRAQCEALASRTSPLERIAKETQLRFDPKSKLRAAIVAQSREDLLKKLAELGSKIADGRSFSTPSGVFLSVDAPEAGGLGFLFPGQGSQYVGMGADLAMGFDVARQVWDQSAAHPFDGVATHQRVFPPPSFDVPAREAAEEQLRATEWAQPAIGVASVAALELFRALGLSPTCMAGHSFGELTALHAAGALDRETLLLAARRRGEVMRDASRGTPGAMSSIKASASVVEGLVRTAPGVVIANYNAPEAIVVAGPTGSIEALERACASSGISATRLPVSTAFHSPLVAPAAESFRRHLDGVTLRAPSVPVLSGANVEPYDGDVRGRLASQLAEPVRFASVIEAMYARGVRVFLEIGPSAVLSGLVDATLGERPHVAISSDRRGRHGMTSLALALARLSVAGVAMRFDALWEGVALRPEPTPSARNAVSLTGTNYGKPYPPPGGSAALPPPNPEKPVAPAPVASPPNAWLATVQETQRRTAETHAIVQKAMLDAHTAFLRAAEASLAAMTGAPMSAMPSMVAMPAPVLTSMFAPSAALAPPTRPPPPVFVAPPPALAAPVPAPIPAPVAVKAPLIVPPKAALDDAPSVLMAIVAEKTGYEVSTLGLDMELEGDLGIDSIKRVEIFAALRDRVPSLPKVQRAELTSLKTLRQVLAFMERTRPAEAAPRPATIELAREHMHLVVAPAPGVAQTRLRESRRVVVTEDGRGVAAALVAELARRGVSAERVDVVPASADAVIFLGGLGDVSDVDGALAMNLAALRAARVVATRFETEPGLFVTVQDTGGDFGDAGADPRRAWLGGLAALVRTARHEWRGASLKAIDCARGDRSSEALASVIAGELLEGGDALCVGLREGLRQTLAWKASPIAPGSPADSIGPTSVVLATGGGRGVTAASLIELAKTHRPKIALLGRSALVDEPEAVKDARDEAALRGALGAEAQRHGRDTSPKEIKRQARNILASREIRATLRALEAAGSEARYHCADVGDRPSLKGALDAVRRDFGPITALVHGAGVLADRAIAHQTDEQLEEVFGPKVRGLAALLELTAEDPIAHIILFSSFSAVAGNAGQAVYAMANETLNHVARTERVRRGERTTLRSIAWGPWEGGMVTPTLQRHFKDLGIPLLSLDAGARAFVDELSAGRGDAVVLVGAGRGLAHMNPSS